MPGVSGYRWRNGMTARIYAFWPGRTTAYSFKRHVPEVTQPGRIIDGNGRMIGEHDGLAFYTIGQRKGLQISAPRPLYVIDKNLETNELIIGEAEDLGRNGLTAVEMNWISMDAPNQAFEAEVKIRYRANFTRAVIIPQGADAVRVEFPNPMRDITAGQRIVIYNDEVVMGGGTIQSSFNT